MLCELSSSLSKTLSKCLVHFFKHDIGSVIDFHTSEKNVCFIATNAFVFTHQAFKFTFWNIGVIVVAEFLWLVLRSVGWSICNKVHEQSRRFMFEFKASFQGTNNIFGFVGTPASTRILDLSLSSLDIFSVLKNVEVLLIAFVSKISVANISDSYFGSDFGSLSDLVN